MRQKVGEGATSYTNGRTNHIGQRPNGLFESKGNKPGLNSFLDLKDLCFIAVLFGSRVTVQSGVRFRLSGCSMNVASVLLLALLMLVLVSRANEQTFLEVVIELTSCLSLMNLHVKQTSVVDVSHVQLFYNALIFVR